MRSTLYFLEVLEYIRINPLNLTPMEIILLFKLNLLIVNEFNKPTITDISSQKTGAHWSLNNTNGDPNET